LETHGNGYIRQAGGLNEVGGTWPDARGHTLGSTETAPGSVPPWSNADGLNCVNCHAAHGSGGGVTNWNSYRNLAGYGTALGYGQGYISYTNTTDDGVNPLTADIHEDAKSGTNASHYGVGALAFNEPDVNASAYAGFCKGCHTDFHGAVGGAEIGGNADPDPSHFVRHPSVTVNIGALGGGHSSITRFGGHVNQVQVMSPAGLKAGSYTDTDTDLTPSCFSCHKSHGNQNAFGLIFMLGTGTITEEGDDGVDTRNMCRQCHAQGGDSTTF
jgi:cytochrome c553